MLVKDIIPCDIVNYKRAAMYIAFPFCSFKCDKEAGTQICQNWSLSKSKTIEISIEDILRMYDCRIAHALLYCGLEPFDSWNDLLELTRSFREKYNDPIIIYTGYNKDEIVDKIETLKKFNNIIIKFGRFIPNHKTHYDEVLGIELASDNQYAERIS